MSGFDALQLLLSLILVPFELFLFLLSPSFDPLLSLRPLQSVLLKLLEVLVLFILRAPLDFVADPVVVLHGRCLRLPLLVELQILGLLHPLLVAEYLGGDEKLLVVLVRGLAEVLDAAIRV